jgi:hypothetical protein
MKIAVYSVGNKKLAGSRLRSHYIFDYNKNKKFKIFRNLKILNFLNINVFHFHMLYKPKYILITIILRIFRKIVIFDICDNPSQLKHKVGFYLMANLASFVFFDTQNRLFFHSRKILNQKKLCVIPDVLDYEPNKNFFFYKKKYNVKNKFLWFGNFNNLRSIEEFVNIIKDNKEYKKYSLYIVSSCKNKKKKNITFLKWKKNFIFEINKKIDFSVLSHEGSKSNLCKSENKMVLSILAGLIPIVSNTPSYQNLAKKLNAEILIYKNSKDIFKIPQKISIRWKKDFITRARKYVISKYSAEKIFNKIINKAALGK